MKAPLKFIAGGLVALALVGAGGKFGWSYYTQGRFMESTDDAYLKADITAISPKIAGYVTEVAVGDNQPVKQGQVLVRIDDQEYQAHVKAAEADVAGTQASLANLDAQLQLQQSKIDQATAEVNAADADAQFAQEEQHRYAQLVQSGAVTRQRVEQADAELKKSAAAVAKSRAATDSARKQIAVLATERDRIKADLDAKNAALDLARIDLANTVITAPASGVTGERAVRVGQYVKPGTQILALVPLDAVYVVANFKETQLGHMQKGEKVQVAIDSFPGTKLLGRLDSLAPASGSEFSLLPPDNATGNFTKIVQRIPVKILLDIDNPLAGKLRPGMSVTSTVDTRQTALAEQDPAQRPEFAQR